jgi:hypothetical protein
MISTVQSLKYVLLASYSLVEKIERGYFDIVLNAWSVRQTITFLQYMSLYSRLALQFSLEGVVFSLMNENLSHKREKEI